MAALVVAVHHCTDSLSGSPLGPLSQPEARSVAVTWPGTAWPCYMIILAVGAGRFASWFFSPGPGFPIFPIFHPKLCNTRHTWIACTKSGKRGQSFSLFTQIFRRHRLRGLRWQALLCHRHQSSLFGVPMLACLQGSRLEPSTELNHGSFASNSVRSIQKHVNWYSRAMGTY